MNKRKSTVAVMIHHTAGNEKNAAALRSVFKSRFGVDYIGYTIAIFPDGSFVQDISWEDWGIHNASGKINNSNSPSISFVGNYSDSLPTKSALETGIKKLQEFSDLYGIKLEWHKTVFGHRDSASTACPGQKLYDYLPEFIGSINKNDMKHIQSYKFSNKETVYGLYAYDTMEEVVGNIVTYSRPSLVKDSDNPEVSLKYGIPTFESVSYLGITEKDIKVNSNKETIKNLESENEKLKKNAQEQTLEIDVLKEKIEELESNSRTVPVYETKEEEQVHGFITKTIEFIRNLLK